MMTKKTIVSSILPVIAVMLAIVCGTQTAQALPITGTINFLVDALPTGSATWYQSTGVNIDPDVNGDQSIVGNLHTGSYSALSNNNPATFTDFTYGNVSGAVNVSLGAGTLWTTTQAGTTYSMLGVTITNLNRGDASNDHVSIIGSGTLRITGVLAKDDTPGTFSFTGGFTGAAPNVSFSATPTPEPASLSLLGLGLVAVGMLRRKLS